MQKSIEEILSAPGNVKINRLVLVSPNRGKFISLLDYLVEVNIYESIFSPGISGSITLSDSRNLSKDLPILAEELLLLDFKTPTLSEEDSIFKTFRITSVSDKHYAKDGSTQVYILNFCSVETYRDVLTTVVGSYEGSPEDIVTRIYNDYMKHPRNVSIEKEQVGDVPSQLTILTETNNIVKFVSPYWSPVKCINWLASKCIPKNNKAANFLFWETTKGFYFGNFDSIFKNADKTSIGEYTYSETMVNTLGPDKVNEKMFTIRNLKVEKSVDNLQNSLSGYLASNMTDVNLYNKDFKFVEYDHVNSFGNYTHTETGFVKPLFDPNTARNSWVHSHVNINYPNLYTDIHNNYDVRANEIFGNRRSNLLELDNFRMTISIPGRTDIEAGQLIKIKLPKSTLIFKDDKVDSVDDDLYSGYYLITSLNHKVNGRSHMVTMTVTKDCFKASEIK